MEAAGFVVLAILQWAAAGWIAQSARLSSMERGALTGLLVVNGFWASFEALRTAELSTVGLQPVASALDASTWVWMVGYVVAPRVPSHRSAAGLGIMGAAAVALSGIVLAIPTQSTAAMQTLVVNVPYYVASAALVISAARRGGTGLWVAAAFLPRAFYFGLPFSVVAVLQWQDFAWYDRANALGLIALLVGALAALVILGRIRGPDRSIGLAALFLGTSGILAGALVVVPAGHPNAIVAPSVREAFNLFTLAMARPLVLMFGIERPRMVAWLGQTAAASGVFLAANLALSLIGWPLAGRLGLAAAFSLMVLALVYPYVARDQRGSDHATGPASARHQDAAPPQWIQMMIALEGSSANMAERLPPITWSQQGLADLLSIKVQRVSELPASVNRRSQRLLARFRVDCPPGEAPILVQRMVGLVEGGGQPRVYYRLTPVGERLVQAIR